MEKAQLLENGFVQRTYEGQTGVFLLKEGIVDDFPYAKEHIVGDPYVHGDSEAMMEITPSGHIQFFIPGAHYVEGPWPLESEEGQGLLKEALAAKVKPKTAL